MRMYLEIPELGNCAVLLANGGTDDEDEDEDEEEEEDESEDREDEEEEETVWTR